MKFNPVSNKIYSISLIPVASSNTPKKSKRNQKEAKEVQANLKLENELYLNNNNTKLFRVSYKVNVDVENSIAVEMVYHFDFEAESEIDERLGTSLYIRSQIPNFCFPYIKSYLEHFLMMSGYGHIPFPYIDFVANPIPAKEEQI